MPFKWQEIFAKLQNIRLCLPNISVLKCHRGDEWNDMKYDEIWWNMMWHVHTKKRGTWWLILSRSSQSKSSPVSPTAPYVPHPALRIVALYTSFWTPRVVKPQFRCSVGSAKYGTGKMIGWMEISLSHFHQATPRFVKDLLDGCIALYQLHRLTKAEVLHAKKVALHTSSLLRPENFFCKVYTVQKTEMLTNARQSLKQGFPEKESFAVLIKNVNLDSMLTDSKSCQQSLNRPALCWQKLARTSFLGFTSGLD